MKERRFAPRCANCHQRTMGIATVPYKIEIDHDAKKYLVSIPNLSVPQCSNCLAISIDEVASEQIDKAFRTEAGLLSGDDIRLGRLKAGFSEQAEFAQCFGIAASTLSKWESGAQVQQHFHDGMLRAFFAQPELRAFLASLHGTNYPRLHGVGK